MPAISTPRGSRWPRRRACGSTWTSTTATISSEVGTKQGWPAEYLRKNRETTDVQRRGFAAAVKAGAKLTFGTDAGVYPYGPAARQFAYMVRYGMTPMQAIQSATSEAAKALRMDGQVGTLAPGAFGDLIAVDGDPLSDIRALGEDRPA